MPGPCLSNDVVVESVRIPGGEFELAGELVYGEEDAPHAAVALAGPHPMLGGSMINNVLRGLGDGLARRGFACLRFNYRGVGESTGPRIAPSEHMALFWQTSRASNEEQHWEDLRSAAAFLVDAVGPDMPLVLAGYSFGCTLLPRAATALNPRALVLLAPTIGTHDLEGFAGIAQPKLLIAPEGDFAVRDEALQDWFSRLNEPRELLRPQLDGHFFRGHEEWLAETVANYLDRLLRYRA